MKLPPSFPQRSQRTSPRPVRHLQWPARLLASARAGRKPGAEGHTSVTQKGLLELSTCGNMDLGGSFGQVFCFKSWHTDKYLAHPVNQRVSCFVQTHSCTATTVLGHLSSLDMSPIGSNVEGCGIFFVAGGQEGTQVAPFELHMFLCEAGMLGCYCNVVNHCEACRKP